MPDGLRFISPALGNGSLEPSADPVSIAGGVAFVHLGDGWSNGHFCAVAPLGEVYCWGRNANGQLGDGTTIERTMPVRVAPPVMAEAGAAGGV